MELTQCTKARNLAHCLARGIDVKGKTTLSEEEGKKLRMEYHRRLGKELGDCTKKEGFAKVCLWFLFCFRSSSLDY